MNKLDDGGEYVGAEPPASVIDQLWVRPEVPVPPPPAPDASAKKSTDSSGARIKGGNSQSSPGAPPSASSSDDDTTSSNGPVSKDGDSLTPPAWTPPRIASGKSSSSPAKPKSNGGPGPTHGAPNVKPTTQPKAPPPPEVAEAQDIPKANRTTDIEKSLAPMIDLISGGQAVGSPNTGRLQAGQPLKSDELIHVLYPERDHFYGAGMMLSLMKNATAKMTEWYPGQSILVGDIAKRQGGYIGHASHQNGLDIDIPYIGTRGFSTMVSGNHVKNELQYAKTWQFLRLVHSQSIVMNGQEQTVMGMVFMMKPIKAGFCAWAKANGLVKNPEDADILRRIVPWPRHDTHFHLRLKCSPHYPACRNLPDPGAGTGC